MKTTKIRSKIRPKSETKRKRSSRPKFIEHPLSSSTEFTNRELGWLNFNLRVLNEAMDTRNPLLERLRFLSIANSNLDEFFMKRVGGLKRQIALGINVKSSDGKTPVQQMISIRQYVNPMIMSQAYCLSKNLKPSLKEQNIHLLIWKNLSAKEKEIAQKYYQKNVFPVLTPLSVDPGHPFPFISNLSTSLGIRLRHPDREDHFFARVKVPQVLPQWVRIETGNDKEFKFISLVELIEENLNDLFPKMVVLNVMPFRLTRNADISRDEEDAEDLLSMIEEELRMRRFAEVVRLEHGPNPDKWMLQFLKEELELEDQDIYELPQEWDLDYTGLKTIFDLPLSHLKYKRWEPIEPLPFREEDIFSLIRRQDQLVHHPYENFTTTVEKFITKAAADPNVLAIKMTLYRTGDNSPFIRSLVKAAEMGKQVVCLIELKARFDEERNIYWAQALENAGVHVVYGIVGLKTHSKTVLVVRNEPDGMVSYAHIGTGNYNSVTAKHYTDLGLFTANEAITSELIEFFNYLTGRSLKTDYKNLMVAPINMFQRMRELIDREAQWAAQKKPAQIFAKMNSMEENDISMALYNASQSGVKIDLVVRGFCCLRPQVKGLSENIRVMSLIGRFLEHSRIFYFRNGKENPLDGDFFIGSADWMYRNLHARVECLVPILDIRLKSKIWNLLTLHLKDQRQTWDMDENGFYKQRNSTELGLQELLMEQAQKEILEEEIKADAEENRIQ